MAETEVLKEVSKMVAIDEKCVLDISSYQDLPKPDCNGTNHHNPVNDIDNSYVFVSGDDSAPDDVDNKDVEAQDSGVLPDCDAAEAKNQRAELDLQIEKLDAVSWEFQPQSEVENRIIEHSSGAPPLVDADKKDMEAEDLSVPPESNATGVRDRGADLGSKVESFDAQLLNEAKGRNIEQNNGHIPLVNVVEAEVLSVVPECDTAGVVDQGAELGSQIENVDAQSLNEAGSRNVELINGDLPLENFDKDVEAGVSNVLPESDTAGVMDQGVELDDQTEISDAVGEEFQPLNKAETRNIEQTNCDLPLVKIDIKDVEAEDSSVLPESSAAGFKEQRAELASQIEKSDAAVVEFQPLNEDRNVEQSNSDPLLVNVDNKDVEAECLCALPESDAAEVKDQEAELDSRNEKYDAVNGAVQSLNKVENRNIKQSNGDPASVNDRTSKHERSHEDGEGPRVSVEDALEENTETLAEAEAKQVQDPVGILGSSAKAEVEKAVDQNEKVQVVTEGEDEKLDDITKPESFLGPSENQEPQVVALGFVAEPGNDECRDRSKLSVAETMEACQGSPDIVVEVVECEVKNVTTDAKDEVKSTKEMAEAAENETPPSTSMDLNLESNPSSHRKDNTVEEAAKTDLLENLRGDTAIGNNVQGMIAQVDESEALLSSSDCHMQSLSDPVLEEKNVDFCASEVDNGAKYLEEIDDQPDQSGVSHDTMSSETMTQASNDHAPQIEIEISESGTDSTLDAVVLTGKEPVSQGDEAHIEHVIEGPDCIRELDYPAGNSNERLFVQENEDTGNSQSNDISVTLAGASSANMNDGKEESCKIKTKPFNFLIRIPRFDDEDLREQIRLAKLHVDEKTKLRDAIQIQIQEIRGNSQIHGIDYEYAKSEARSARKSVRSKRMEIDSLQSVINKAKNALSIEDIDSQIYNTEHMIQHETLPLKEEKQLIREIKQLKQLREQLSSNMGSQDEIQQAVEQREEVEERLKILRKELDILKNSVLKAEATAAEAEKKYDDENKKVKELQARFRVADDVRQAAYAQWQNLRKELSKKSKHFFKYKDDAAVASNYAFSRDTEALYCLCMSQVENFMELWNTNEEFRREYVRFNARSTVRRFGTLDGRPLGPDEEPPLLPSSYGNNDRVSRVTSTPVPSQIPSPELKQETINENVTLEGKSVKKATESKYQKVTEAPALVTVQSSNGLAIADKELVYEEEPPVKSREEIELLRREEEKRREEAEAKLKEQRRLEALAKAHEARERKKRQAEKLQMRAELKTQKEAEQREKEREKRLRKKERKKAGITTDVNESYSCETAQSSESSAENSKDTEGKEVGPKKGKKPWLSGKQQSRTKSIPPPLRNRNKKKLQQWMWVGVTSVVILVLFWLGNIGVFSNVALKRRGGPIH